VRRKTVHLQFELGDDAGQRFQAFERALQAVAACQRIWRVTTQEMTSDWKRHAGASHLVTLHAAALERRLPPYFETNLHPFCLRCGAQSLYFFPDQVLVYEGNRVGAVSYDSLELETARTAFRETGWVPSDAKVIDHTWRYVNRAGGPDRRFSQNSRIPICEYERVRLSSPSGLNIHLMLSRAGPGEELKAAEACLVPVKRQEPVDADELAFEEWLRSQRAGRTGDNSG
jgi:hypothetical protein